MSETESSPTTPTTERGVVVSVDAWQNQRYKPLQGGWTTNVNSVGPSEYMFSDITGDKCVPYSDGVDNASTTSTTPSATTTSSLSKGGVNTKEAFLPTAVLPDGWDWVGGWKIDSSDTYGKKDDGGWSYSNNFESLYKQSMCRNLSGTNQRMSMARRRRWTRRRIAVTSNAKEQFIFEKQMNDHICAKLSEVMGCIDDDWKFLIAFNKLRVEKISELGASIDRELQVTIDILENTSEKLTLLKTYLRDRAQLEFNYSKQLESFSEKWINAGKPKQIPASASSNRSSNNNGFKSVSGDNSITSSLTNSPLSHHQAATPAMSSPLKLPSSENLLKSSGSNDQLTIDVDSSVGGQSIGIEASDDQDDLADTAEEEEEEEANKNSGFFSLICTASNSVARRLGDFSLLMSSSIYHNVEQLSLEVDSALRDLVMTEAPKLKKKLQLSMYVAELRFQLCEKVLKQSRTFLFSQRHATSHSLVNKSALSVIPADLRNLDGDGSCFYTVPEFLTLIDLRRSPWAYLINGLDIASESGSTSSDSTSTLSSISASLTPTKKKLSFSLGGTASSLSGSTSSSSLSSQAFEKEENKTNSYYSNLPIGGFDSWLVLQMYRQNVLEAEGNVMGFQSFVQQQGRYTNDLMTRVSNMLQDTVLTFATEQSRAYDDSKTILQTIVASINAKMTSRRKDGDICVDDSSHSNQQHPELWKDYGGDEGDDDSDNGEGFARFRLGSDISDEDKTVLLRQQSKNKNSDNIKGSSSSNNNSSSRSSSGSSRNGGVVGNKNVYSGTVGEEVDIDDKINDNEFDRGREKGNDVTEQDEEGESNISVETSLSSSSSSSPSSSSLPSSFKNDSEIAPAVVVTNPLSWRMTSLNFLQVKRYILKGSRIKFAMFPKVQRRNSVGMLSNHSSLKLTLEELPNAGSTPLSYTLSSSGNKSIIYHEYEVPKYVEVGGDGNTSRDSLAYSATASANDKSGPFTWNSGVILMTSDAAVHILSDHHEFGSSSIYSLLDPGCRNDFHWTAHVPVISSECNTLRAEPSPILFPGVTGEGGDGLVLRFNKAMVHEPSHAESSSNFGLDPNHGRFMSAFVRDSCPIGIVLQNSSEVKLWLDKFRNPYH